MCGVIVPTVPLNPSHQTNCAVCKLNVLSLRICVCAESVEPQRILVICCSNSELHITVLRKFLRFLEAKCNVRVAAVDNNCVMTSESVHHWLVEEMELAQKVLLVHSNESVALAWQFTRSPTTSSISLETFMTALEMFSRSAVDPMKLLNVYFSYSSADCVVDVQCGQTFQLMKEFDAFLASVLGISKVDSSSLLNSSEGCELQLAINEAATYNEVHMCSYDNYCFAPPDADGVSIGTVSSSVLCMAAGVENEKFDSEVAHQKVVLANKPDA